MTTNPELRSIRRLIAFFAITLFISGATAVPIDPELSFLLKHCTPGSALHYWLGTVLSAYREVAAQHPFLLYGYDWLAFAHLVLALLFIGPYRKPVRNIWVIQFSMLACILVLPLALIAGPLRGIPLGWRLIDCSFGVIGIIPLYICYKKIRSIEHRINHSQPSI